MSKDYEKMTAEELQAEVDARTRAKMVDALRKEDEAAKKASEDAYKAEVEAKIRSELMKEAPIAPKINTVVPESSGKASNKYVDWLKDYTGGKLRTYEAIESKGSKVSEYWGTSADDPRNTACPTDVANWSPEGVWVAAIWHDFYEYANLLQVVVPGLNIDKGAGFRALIRTISPFSTNDITSSLDPCECLSCTSTSINKTYIDIEEHGFSTVICEHDLWDVGEVLRTATLKEFTLVWSKFFDEEIYAALDAATGNADANQELDSCVSGCGEIAGSCCTDTFMMDLYCAFDRAILEMRAAYYNPDFIIIHPEVSAVFRGVQGPQPVFYNSALKWGENGKLLSIFGVKVIEYNGANRIGDGENIAIILDSRRAIGAPFGMRPKMESEYNKECAAYEYYMRCYWGVDVLTENAIALISCAA
jgi:hypothetical protein